MYYIQTIRLQKVDFKNFLNFKSTNIMDFFVTTQQGIHYLRKLFYGSERRIVLRITRCGRIPNNADETPFATGLRQT